MPAQLRKAALACLLSCAAAAGGEMGASVTRTDGVVSGVEFRVWAPNAASVSVVGDFNEWNPASNSMQKEAGEPWGGVWKAFSSEARPGHAYKYSIADGGGSTKLKNDPRGRKVSVTPEGFDASVVYDRDAFDWGGEDFAGPEPADTVAYELHIGTFYDPSPLDGKPGTFDDAARKLDYLREIGVNMVALMPVSEFGGEISWGYNPTDPFAIERSYGGPDGLKRFVREAHRRGIGVQVDIVHNHYDWTSGLVDFDGGNPYFYTDPGGKAFTQWGPRPRYSDPGVRSYISDQVRMFFEEYRVQAVRWDSPRNITGYDSDWDGQPDTPIPEAEEMMAEVNAGVVSGGARRYTISEDSGVPGDYSGHWEAAFHDRLLSQLLPRQSSGEFNPPFNSSLWDAPLSQFGYLSANKEAPGFRVIFADNHDKSGDLNSSTDGQRLLTDLGAGRSDPDARKKAMLAAAAVLTADGTPMLFMGQEQMARGDFNSHTALAWGAAGKDPQSVRLHRDLISLRRNIDGTTRALASSGGGGLLSGTRVLHLDEAAGTIAYERRTGDGGESVVVALNFSGVGRTVGIGLPAPGPWRCRFNSDQKIYGGELGGLGSQIGDSVTTSGSDNFAALFVPRYSALIFCKNGGGEFASDEDGDGLDDGWEILFSAKDPGGDDDSDGFTNLQEYGRGTDPTEPDRGSLAGNFNDWEYHAKSMRWDPGRGAWVHVSRFLLPGPQECVARPPWGGEGKVHSFTVDAAGVYETSYNPADGSYATLKNDLDGDADGMADSWEGFYFYPQVHCAGAGDPDGDGLSNLEEFQRGSDPSAPDLLGAACAGGFSGWSWGKGGMRYAGHGVWLFCVPRREESAGAGFRVRGFGVDSGTWGDDQGDGVGDLWAQADMQFGAGPPCWRLVRFNEKSLKYSEGVVGGGDGDGDGMPDTWEFFYGMDPFSDGRTGDIDSDGVENYHEYRRLTLPTDSGDHYLSMHMAQDGLWGEGDPLTAMRWNRTSAMWEYALFAPRGLSREFKFIAGTYGGGTWGWEGGGTRGSTVKWANGNAAEAVPTKGHYLIRFDESNGGYEFDPMENTDADGDGMPDGWERFHGLDPLSGLDRYGDLDGDGVSNGAEWTRGGNPRRADHLQSVNFTGTHNGWNTTGEAMRWDSGRLAWRLLLKTPLGGEGKFLAGQTWSDQNWGDSDGDGVADARSSSNIRYGQAGPGGVCPTGVR